VSARTRSWLRALLAASVVTGEVFAAGPEHTPVICGMSFRGPDRQVDIGGPGDLPPDLQQLIERHINERVGSRYAADLTFDRGQMKNLDSLGLSPPPEEPLARALYNLLYRFRLSPTQEIVACVLVEPDGEFAQELSLPAWAHGAAPPRLVTRTDAEVVAREHGMSGHFKHVEVGYFPDTDTLEWLFSETTHEDGVRLRGRTLHIPVQDPEGVHWSKWEAIR